MNTRTLTILAGLAAIAVLAAILAVRSQSRPATTPSAQRELLLPALSARLDDVAAIRIRTASGQSAVERTGDRWRLTSMSGYPVDAAKVRELLLRLAALGDLEPRTERPNLYPTLGVEDVAPAPDSPDQPAPPPAAPSRAAEVTLLDDSGATIAAVIIGDSKTEGGFGPAASRKVYVRRPGEAASYLAGMGPAAGSRALDLPREPIAWLDAQFADIRRDRIWTVELTPRKDPESDRILIARDQPTQGAFSLQNMPEGRELVNPGFVESVVSALSQTTFDAVKPETELDFSSSPGTTAKVRTNDGLIITIDTAATGDGDGARTWWRLSAAPDPEPYLAPPAPAAATADGADAPPTPAPAPLRSAEQVTAELQQLNARWAGWAYAPVPYKAAAFEARLSEQLKPAAPSVPAPTPAPAP